MLFVTNGHSWVTKFENNRKDTWEAESFLISLKNPVLHKSDASIKVGIATMKDISEFFNSD